ncbi:class I SAM-dependent methyltransferase [Porticoccaceae bacterium LTM1]|nr:class I SAM-dependent methyltransferase [Porticoccaceae bacterium LTM1]
MNNQASQFIGSIPENYDKGLVPHIFDDFANDLVSLIVSHNPRAVLELAAGTGVVTRKLRDALTEHSTIVATDLNPPMLNVAQAKFSPDEQVRFEEVDATLLPYQDDSFDLITCQFGVMFFPDKEASYIEAHRVLKSGGRYIFNTWGSWERNAFAELAHNAVSDFFPEDPPQFYKVPFSYHDMEAIQQSLLCCGFDDVQFHPTPKTVRILSADLLAKGLVFGNPLYDEIVNRNGSPEAVYQALKTMIENTLGDQLRLFATTIEALKR